MQERHDKLFDIQFFADDGDESDDEKNKGGGSGGDPVILAEELTAGEFETLDKTFRRAYVEKDGKYYLNRKGRDVLSEALKKEREYREKAENALKGLGMSVEDAKKLLDDHKKQKEQSKTEAERMQEAIENARKESDATKAALKALEEKLAEEQLNTTRLRVQNELKVPEALMRFIVGSNYEELHSAAEELMKHMKEPDPSKKRVGGGMPHDDEGNNMPDPKEMEEQIKAGLKKAEMYNKRQGGDENDIKSYY